jgi:hypothetical protein
MPEVFREEGFVFFFYANEGNEPMHIHIRKAGGYAKFWLIPIELDSSKGLKSSDIIKAENIIKFHYEQIKDKWYEVFGY